ncbi:MAG: hypothetical protein O7G32_10515 [SAR324 cluster bacterium]|nr:hypothetical protein [SAR324 cluster bacterium]
MPIKYLEDEGECEPINNNGPIGVGYGKIGWDGGIKEKPGDTIIRFFNAPNGLGWPKHMDMFTVDQNS